MRYRRGSKNTLLAERELSRLACNGLEVSNTRTHVCHLVMRQCHDYAVPMCRSDSGVQGTESGLQRAYTDQRVYYSNYIHAARRALDYESALFETASSRACVNSNCTTPAGTVLGRLAFCSAEEGQHAIKLKARGRT